MFIKIAANVINLKKESVNLSDNSINVLFNLLRFLLATCCIYYHGDVINLSYFLKSCEISECVLAVLSIALHKLLIFVCTRWCMTVCAIYNTYINNRSGCLL